MFHSFLKDRSQILIVFVCLLLLVLRLLKFPDNILTWDVFGYYLYLPANFIYHDPAILNTNWLENLMKQYDPSSSLYQLYPMEGGKMLIKYTSGTAILTLPFFLLAHFLAPLLNYPADGLSLPYQLSMALGGMVYAFVGLFYFKKILEHFFEKNLALLVLMLVVFGTNYLQIVAFDGTLLTHNFLFTFYAILVYYTIKWHEKQDVFSAKMIALSFGFISLLRPTEAVSILIPLLYNVYDKESFRVKVQLIRSHFAQLKMMVFIIIVIWIPQLLYWKYVSGEYFINSYQNAGEGLDFLTPYIIEFLFSFRKGWLIYTPIIVFALIGFIFLFLKNKPLFYAIFLFTVVNMYVISSWTCWWYAGGSYSARAIIPAYTVLAFPLGYFLVWIKERGLLLRAGITVIFLLLVVLNLFQTWQFENGIISKQRMTRAYYKAIFGKTSVGPEAKKLLLVERPEDGNFVLKDESSYSKKVLFSLENIAVNDTIDQLLGKENLYSKGVEYQFKKITGTDQEVIGVSAKIKSDLVAENQQFYLVMSLHHNNIPYGYRAEKILLRQGEWFDVKFDFEAPELQNVSDTLRIYFWNKDEIESVIIEDFLVEACEIQVLDKENIYSKGIDYQFQELTAKDHAWVRVKARVKSDAATENEFLYLVRSFHHKDKPFAYMAEEISLPKGEWVDVQFDYLTPEVRSKNDNLKLYFWNKDQVEKITISDFEVEVFEKKD